MHEGKNKMEQNMPNKAEDIEITIDKELFDELQMKYRQYEGQITFDEFVTKCLEYAIESYKEQCRN